jgi:hypothetical protein
MVPFGGGEATPPTGDADCRRSPRRASMLVSVKFYRSLAFGRASRLPSLRIR